MLIRARVKRMEAEFRPMDHFPEMITVEVVAASLPLTVMRTVTVKRQSARKSPKPG